MDKTLLALLLAAVTAMIAALGFWFGRRDVSKQDYLGVVRSAIPHEVDAADRDFYVSCCGKLFRRYRRWHQLGVNERAEETIDRIVSGAFQFERRHRPPDAEKSDRHVIRSEIRLATIKNQKQEFAAISPTGQSRSLGARIRAFLSRFF